LKGHPPVRQSNDCACHWCACGKRMETCIYHGHIWQPGWGTPDYQKDHTRRWWP
jgi:hypothetical protein